MPNSCPISVDELRRTCKAVYGLFSSTFKAALGPPRFAKVRIIPLSRRKQGFESPRERHPSMNRQKAPRLMVFSIRTAITLAYVTAVGALIVTPSLAGDNPTDTAAVSTAPPSNSVHHRHGVNSHHHQRPANWGWNQRRFRLSR